MKKITLVLILLSAVSLLFFLTGCTEEDSGMSIEDRIDAFVSDLNGSSSTRAGIFKEHFHPDSYSYTGSEGTIDSAFETAGQNYSITSISGSGSSRTVVIDGDSVSTDYGSYTFDMREEDDDDWLIFSVYDNDNTIYSLPGTAP